MHSIGNILNSYTKLCIFYSVPGTGNIPLQLRSSDFHISLWNPDQHTSCIEYCFGLFDTTHWLQN